MSQGWLRVLQVLRATPLHVGLHDWEWALSFDEVWDEGEIFGTLFEYISMGSRGIALCRVYDFDRLPAASHSLNSVPFVYVRPPTRPHHA